MKKNIKLIASIIFGFFIAINILYIAININKEQRIDMSLNQSLSNLETHINILLYNQKRDSSAAYQSILLIPNLLETLSQIESSTEKEKIILREKLLNILNKKYEIAKTKGVFQIQFVLPDNISFLRMHKIEKFGDDLTEIREDFNFVNKNRKSISGFVHGATSHSFRNVFPIFHTDGRYLGAMEISFLSDGFQSYLEKVSQIHTHFIFKKEYVESKKLDKSEFIKSYIESYENEKYLINKDTSHLGNLYSENCENISLDFFKRLDTKIDIGDKFSILSKDNKIVSFFPVRNVAKTKNIAWFVSFEKSEYIAKTLIMISIMKTIFAFIFIIIGYFFYKQKISTQQSVKDHDFLRSVLNSTNSIIFLTDFKKAYFSNKKFKNFFDVNKTTTFNEKMENNILSIFVHINGYLNSSLLKDSETFYNLVIDSKEEDRVVSILNKKMHLNAFHINITKTDYGEYEDYLITLTDITKIKEKELKIEEKAYIDTLTGVFNRNKFDEIAENEIIRSSRYKNSLSLAIIDIDHFKKFNDTFGHLIGDEVLTMLAQNLKNSVRDTDTFARWGGEEFVILFPEISKEQAKIASDKLRVGIENLYHPVAGRITASFGVTEYLSDDSLKSMLKRCDDALYKAKESGRNIVCIK